MFYRQDPVAITTPGVKLLVYKDCKKNFQRVMKFHADRKNSGGGENPSPDPFVDIDRQFLKDNLNTMEVRLFFLIDPALFIFLV